VALPLQEVRITVQARSQGGFEEVRTNPPCSLAKFIFNETAAVQGTIIQPCSGIVTGGIHPTHCNITINQNIHILGTQAGFLKTMSSSNVVRNLRIVNPRIRISSKFKDLPAHNTKCSACVFFYTGNSYSYSSSSKIGTKV